MLYRQKCQSVPFLMFLLCKLFQQILDFQLDQIIFVLIYVIYYKMLCIICNTHYDIYDILYIIHVIYDFYVYIFFPVSMFFKKIVFLFFFLFLFQIPEARIFTFCFYCYLTVQMFQVAIRKGVGEKEKGLEACLGGSIHSFQGFSVHLSEIAIYIQTAITAFLWDNKLSLLVPSISPIFVVFLNKILRTARISRQLKWLVSVLVFRLPLF